MADDPRERRDQQSGDTRQQPDRQARGQAGGEDTFVDRHLGKIVAAALLIGLIGIAARALVA